MSQIKINQAEHDRLFEVYNISYEALAALLVQLYAAGVADQKGIDIAQIAEGEEGWIEDLIVFCRQNYPQARKAATDVLSLV